MSRAGRRASFGTSALDEPPPTERGDGRRALRPSPSTCAGSSSPPGASSSSMWASGSRCGVVAVAARRGDPWAARHELLAGLLGGLELGGVGVDARLRPELEFPA